MQVGRLLPFPSLRARDGRHVLDPLPLLRRWVKALRAASPSTRLPRRSTRASPRRPRTHRARGRQRSAASTVALGGGTFQNARLLASLAESAAGRRPARAYRARAAAERWRDQLRPGRRRRGAAGSGSRLIADSQEDPMCLGIPGRITEVHDENGVLDGNRGLRRRPSLMFASPTSPMRSRRATTPSSTSDSPSPRFPKTRQSARTLCSRR